MAQPSVLIIEDEPGVRAALAKCLQRHGCLVDAAATGTEGLERLTDRSTDLVLLDYRLPDADGLEILKHIRERHPEILTVMITAFTSVDVAIQAMRLGAYDYVAKPFNLDEIVVIVDKALEAKRLRLEVDRLHTVQQEKFGFDRIVASSPNMLKIIHLLKHLAASETRTILLQGESGTGKDLAALIIHYNGARSERPFMNITCTALPETLLESELFGHERGAFTDARQQKKGLFELADGGTIFLDEIGDMPASLQAKLLRFLEEKTFRRVGGTADIQVDVRIITATNRDMQSLVEEGTFREDLFYRLNIFPVTLPPLRDRPEDLPLLAQHFIEQYNLEFHKHVTGIEIAALAVMQAYDWPGNVRELRNVIERAMLLAHGGQLTLADLPPATVRAPKQEEGLVIRFGPEGIDIKEVERRLVQQALARTQGNQSRAAAMLHMSRDQLRYRIQKYGLKGGKGEADA